LERQLERAKDENIIMFCSSSDQSTFSSDKFLPYSSGRCIKIGAATDDGYCCSRVDNKVDFILPGKDISFNWERADGAMNKIESGSSQATALAAGLGAILLYAYRVFNPATERNLHLDISDIRSKLKMEEMFTNLSVTKSEKKRYIQADHIFSRVFLSHIKANPGTSVSELPWSRRIKQGLWNLLEEIKKVPLSGSSQ
jgi:hypothetical protein